MRRLEAEKAALASKSAGVRATCNDAPRRAQQKQSRLRATSRSSARIPAVITQARGTQVNGLCPTCSARINGDVSGEPTRQTSPRIRDPAAGRHCPERVHESSDRLDFRKDERVGDCDLKIAAGAGASDGLECTPALRLMWKQLTPVASFAPGRVSAMSYPRYGSRVMLDGPVEGSTHAKGGDPTVRSTVELSGVSDSTASGTVEQPGAGVKDGTLPGPPEESEALERVLILPMLALRPSPSPCESTERTGALTQASYMRGPCGERIDHSQRDKADSGEKVDEDRSAEVASPSRMQGQGQCSEGVDESSQQQPETDLGVEVVGDGRPCLVGDNREENDSVPRFEGSLEDSAHYLCHSSSSEAMKRSGSEASRRTTAGVEGETVRDEETTLAPRPEQEYISGATVPRLVGGIRVLKYGGSGRGKTKAKTLWVTPDLSEIYYTAIGR